MFCFGQPDPSGAFSSVLKSYFFPLCTYLFLSAQTTPPALFLGRALLGGLRFQAAALGWEGPGGLGDLVLVPILPLRAVSSLWVSLPL